MNHIETFQEAVENAPDTHPTTRANCSQALTVSELGEAWGVDTETTLARLDAIEAAGELRRSERVQCVKDGTRNWLRVEIPQFYLGRILLDNIHQDAARNICMREGLG